MTLTDNNILTRYGYDPDDPVRGLDIPAELAEDLGAGEDEEDEEAQ